MTSSSNQDRSDGSLVRGIRRGEDDAAEVFVQRYVARLHRMANQRLAKDLQRRVDPQDLSQSIFRTLFRRIRDGQYDVPEGESIWSLLATITSNKIRAVGTFHRREKRDIARTGSAETDGFARNARHDETLLADLRMTIEELTGHLSATQKQIIQMRLEGEEVQAIANATARPKRTVERTLQMFRKELKRVIE